MRGPERGPSCPSLRQEAFLFAGIFLVYLVFLCPGLYNGDSPLLSASAFALGPAHPPGYPLYVALGKAMTFLPFGSVAFRLNLLSAISGAAAAVLVYKSVKTLTEDKAASAFAALMAASMPLAWAESTKAEVYTLNAALVMAVFYLGVRFLKDAPDRRLLFLASLVLGLAMGNHHTSGFMALPLGLAVLMRAREPRTVFFCILFFMAGMGIYALSYLRSLKYASDGALFAYSDSGGIEQFFITFFREEYKSNTALVASSARDPLLFLRGAYNAARYLIYGNMGILGLFAIFSVPSLWRKKAALSFALAAFAAYAVVLSAMVYAFKSPGPDTFFVLNPYLLPALYIASALAGCGLSFVRKAAVMRFPPAGKALAIAAALLPVVLILPGTVTENNLSSYYLVEDYSENLLDALPPESIIISGSDSSYFPLAFKAFVEKKRDDVLLLYADGAAILTQATPKWSYMNIFPDLPALGHFAPVDPKYFEARSTFAFEPMFLPRSVLAKFNTTPYIHSYSLIPDREGIDDAQIDEEFRMAFKALVYERSLKERASDAYSDELKMSMFIPLSHYAYLMKKTGESDASRKYYAESLRLFTPKGLAHYMNYLKSTGGRDEALSFIETIEPYAKKNPDMAELAGELRKQFRE